MTKLQKYNNVIFAVAGTLGIILAIYAFFRIVIDNLPSNFDSNKNAVLSTEKVNKLANENQLQQLLNFEVPIVLDTTKGLYLFPISQKTLRRPSLKQEVVSDFFECIPTRNVRQQVGLTSILMYGNYNNLIVSKNCDSNFQLVFNFRVCVTTVGYLNYPQNPILVIVGTTKDSNKDNVLTSEDLQELVIYNIYTRQLNKIALENYSVIKYVYVNSIDKLIIEYGVDSDHNGKFDPEKEPTVLKSYSFKTNKLESVIDSTLLKTASNLLINTEK